MGKVTGFKEFEREDESYIAVEERVANYNEFTVPLSEAEITKQGSRCMDRQFDSRFQSHGAPRRMAKSLMDITFYQ